MYVRACAYDCVYEHVYVQKTTEQYTSDLALLSQLNEQNELIH